jgi:hypothetical protein
VRLPQDPLAFLLLLGLPGKLVELVEEPGLEVVPNYIEA